MTSSPRSYVIQHSRSAACSPNALMRIIKDPSTWPKWQSEIIETTGDIPLSEGDRVDGKARLLGFEVSGQSSTITATSSSFIEDVIVGVRMRVEYTVDETPRGTIITRRLTTALPGGLSGHVLSFFLKRRLKAMQKDLLNELVGQAEAG